MPVAGGRHRQGTSAGGGQEKAGVHEGVKQRPPGVPPEVRPPVRPVEATNGEVPAVGIGGREPDAEGAEGGLGAERHLNGCPVDVSDPERPIGDESVKDPNAKTAPKVVVAGPCDGQGWGSLAGGSRFNGEDRAQRSERSGGSGIGKVVDAMASPPLNRNESASLHLGEVIGQPGGGQPKACGELGHGLGPTFGKQRADRQTGGLARLLQELEQLDRCPAGG